MLPPTFVAHGFGCLDALTAAYSGMETLHIMLLLHQDHGPVGIRALGGDVVQLGDPIYHTPRS